MAIIPRHTARKQLPGSPMPAAPNFSGLANAGRALQTAGARLQARQEQMEAFETEQAWTRFDLETRQQLEQSAQNITPGGTGFHDGFVSEYDVRADKFLESVPERLKPRFQEIAQTNRVRLSATAAKVENTETRRYAIDSIEQASQGLLAGIQQNPNDYGALAARGRQLIASSPLSPVDKMQAIKAWQAQSSEALARQQIAEDPARAMALLGFGEPGDRYAALAEAITPHQIEHESAGNPEAVSRAGAIGLMQIMPATAEDIATALGDEAFPAGDPQAIEAYLKRPDVSRLYGQAYMTQLLQRYDGDLEASLIAYNAGMKHADRWLERGRDYASLPRRSETEPYVSRILGDFSAGRANVDRDDGQVYDDQSFRSSHFSADDFRSKDGASLKIQRSTVEFADALVDRTGIRFQIISGHRSEARNKKIGGADDSQHVHGTAIDIDLTGLSKEQRRQLLTAALQMGARGVGLYSGGTSMHLDLRAATPRAWFDTGEGSYSTLRERSKGVSWETRLERLVERYPDWAREPMRQYFSEDRGPAQPAGFAAMVGNVDPRLAGLDYAQRTKLANQAQTELRKRQSAQAYNDTAEFYEIEKILEDDVASVEETGVGAPDLDEDRALEVLGEKAIAEYRRDRAKAELIYRNAHDLDQLTDQELEARIRGMRPVGGDAQFAIKKSAQEEIASRVEKIRSLRAKDPAEAVMNLPGPAEAFRQISELPADAPVPQKRQAMETLIREILAEQEAIGITGPSAEPIPERWAQEWKDRVVSMRDAGEWNQDGIKRLLFSMEDAFGTYADDVLLQVLTQMMPDRDKDLALVARRVLSTIADENIASAMREAGVSDTLAEVQDGQGAQSGIGSMFSAFGTVFGDLLQSGIGRNLLRGGRLAQTAMERAQGSQPKSVQTTEAGPLAAVPSTHIRRMREHIGNEQYEDDFADLYGKAALDAVKGMGASQ